MRQSGFTLVELIVVMIIVGILAVAAIPRFFQTQTFAARGFHDQVLAMVRFAHKTAIAQRRDVFVNANAATNVICLTYVADASCTSGVGVVSPGQAGWFSNTAPNGVTLSGNLAFRFSALGRPLPDAPVNYALSIVGDGVTRTITIERETGHVH